MKDRCFCRKTINYKNYGGRGITICNEWKDDFVAFKDWAMANGYADSLSIDRIDNNGNYEPSNCRWTTVKEQQSNRNCNRMITFEGETHTIAEWARIKGLTKHCLWGRIVNGWDIEKALTQPSRAMEVK